MATVSIEQALQIGVAQQRANRFDVAEGIYREILSKVPDHADATHLLGVTLLQQRKLDESIALLRQAVALRPQNGPMHYNLGTALIARRDFAEAVGVLVKAVQLDPHSAAAHHNLAAALLATDQFDAAAATLQRALDLKPDGQTWNNLGELLKTQGRLDEALACMRRAVELMPGHPQLHSNLLCALNYAQNVPPAEIFAEHRRWSERHERPLRDQIRPHENDRSPERRLRVGYMSPDLHEHPVGFFIEPVITHHHRDRFEVFCYSDFQQSDPLSERLKASANCWRDIVGTSDEKLAEMVREDRIDVLIDLAGHTAHNRLLAFARKPAPVQAAYLGYVNTTGMDAMDYCIGHKDFDPPGGAPHIEKPILLPRAFVCYRPRVTNAVIGDLPALRNGFVAFVCMNSVTKVTPATIGAWLKILARVPRSKLVIFAQSPPPRELAERMLAGSGVTLDRIEFVPRRPLEEYYADHNSYDIALDPFPHNGGTTTCDALWMGVPVVTFPGNTPISRGGLSFLRTVNLPELIADSLEGYVNLAVTLANDLPRLAELRRTLRPRMEASPLMDAEAMASDLEDAYRTMWRAWCAS